MNYTFSLITLCILTGCYIFDFIAYARQVLLKSGLRDNYSAATIVGVERKRLGFF